MTVVNHTSCSFLPLLAAEGEDTQSRMGLMVIHFPHFNKASPTDETQNRRRKVFISESKAEAIECITHTYKNTHRYIKSAYPKALNTNWTNEKDKNPKCDLFRISLWTPSGCRVNLSGLCVRMCVSIVYVSLQQRATKIDDSVRPLLDDPQPRATDFG